MLPRTCAIVILASFLGLASAIAIPLNAIQLGSRHNLYLTTCTPIPDDGDDCPIPIFCKDQGAAAAKYTAVAYFANGPIESNQGLTDIATVTDPAKPWEGTQRVAKIGKTSSFSSRIAADAAKLKYGEIAGSAVMDNEDFVCFKDGSTAFVVTKDLSNKPYSCKTDYWCPSILV